MNTFAKVKQKARNILNDSRGSHDWEHTLRVYRLAEHIGKVEQANLEIVRLAALLHDIGRHHQDISNGKVCHAKKGAEMAREILKIRPDIRILLCTGHSDRMSAEIAQRMGIAGYLQKPVEIESMAQTVRAILDRPPSKETVAG